MPDKLSPNYRKDAIDGLPNEIREYLDQNYAKKLINLDTRNPRVLVVFSGGNAVGKSTLSAKIQERFKAIVLENDAVKRNLLLYRPPLPRDQLNPLTWQYTMGLYKRLEQFTPNGLVVRDGIIDWYFDRILPLFEAQGYSLFVIAFDLTREEAAECVRSRGDTPTVTVDALLGQLDEHEIHRARFRKLYQSNVTLQAHNLFDHDAVMQSLGDYLGSLPEISPEGRNQD